ncbi:MAG TPA: acyl-CoA synthetase [Gammaproteobacteria bacterium]|nr:acyl-CoA synthetase [Gammaproteobacteria bacterium]
MAASSFWQWVNEEPDRLALVSDDYREFSFGEVGARVNQLSRGFASLGLKTGDCVAILLNNVPEWIEVYMATQQSGLFLTAINYHLTGPEVAYILENSESKVFITTTKYKESVTKAVDEIDFDTDFCFAIDELPGFRHYEDILAGEDTAPPENRVAGSLMLYTSGTTGKPKGVRRPLVEGALPDATAMAGSMLAMLFDIKSGEGAHLAQGPLYHAAPAMFSTGAMHLGQSLVLMDKWTPEAALERIEKYKITATHMVPTMFHRLLDLPESERNRYDLSSLKNVIHAAAPCPPETKRKMLDWWGPVIYEYYAATEGGGAYVKPDEWLQHPGTVGRAFPGAQLKILDEEGNELPPNEPGTIYMGTPVGEFEYYKDKKKTEASRHGGLFTVGDIGYLTEDGWLFICDRKNDMIISGGVNIYPAEIEATLQQHDKIADVAVFGIPDDDWGESVKAVVELIPGASGNDSLTEDILAFAKERLAKYKLPRSIDYIDELPRLPTGKLYKRILRDKYWENKERQV